MSTDRHAMIETIRRFPDVLTEVVGNLTHDQLTMKIPDDPWTIQQIVHHMADSHINSIIRLKLILTNDSPTLQGYDQDAWVTLPDVATPIENTLLILRGLHVRWCALWDSMTEEQWNRVGIHTEMGPVTPDRLLVIYSNHCNDHLAQIKRILATAPTK